MGRRIGIVAGGLLLALTAAGHALGLRVGSYNIRNASGDKGTENAWDARKADLAALIRSLDLDALGLQEVQPEQADYLRESLPGYAMIGVHRDDGARKGEASPVFYRQDHFEAMASGTFWLSLTPDVPGSMSWGTECTRICSWALLKDRATGLCFCFCNTHTDHVSAEARREGMLLIIRRMKEFSPAGTPIIFTGDHNCKETEAPAVAVSALLRNALLVSETTPTGSWRTFNSWEWKSEETPCADALALTPAARNSTSFSNTAGRRIDYIYVSDDVRVKGFATHADPRPGLELYPSDHFPITATLEIPVQPAFQSSSVSILRGSLAPTNIPYAHYRFKVEEVHGSSAIGMQVSELSLLCEGEDVTRKYLESVARAPLVPEALADSAVSNGHEYWNPADINASEGVAKAIDGTTTTKFYDCNASPTRSNAEYRDKCWIQLNYTNAVRVTAYRWATANDNLSLNGNCRTPKSFRLQGSDDGETWVDLNVQTNFTPPTTAFTWTQAFPVGGAADTDGYATDAKWFRLAILRKQDNTIWSAQLAEFELYDASGNRVNAGLSAVAKDLAASALNPGEATASEPAGATHGVEGEVNGGFGMLFDGNPATKYICGCTLDDSHRIVVTLRLPDAAAAVAGYGFLTAADARSLPGRNPNCWTLEASRDGETWFMLDARQDALTPAASNVLYNGGMPYRFQGPGVSSCGSLAAEGVIPDLAVPEGDFLTVGASTVKIGGLTLDCAAGVGMLDRLNAAEQGQVTLVNCAGIPFDGYVLPIAVGVLSNGGNLSSWPVYVDGAVRRDLRLAPKDGRLVLTELGFRLLIR